MRYTLVLLLLSASCCLFSCSVISKDKVEIEKIADDVIEEIIDDISA